MNVNNIFSPAMTTADFVENLCVHSRFLDSSRRGRHRFLCAPRPFDFAKKRMA